jgi:hypothetical protein
MRGRLWLAVATAAALVAAPSAGGEAAPVRDDTVWLQQRLDAGGRVVIPALPEGECYRTRGLWVSRDATEIVSNGACIVGTAPGQQRMRSTDGDPIRAEAVFYISRSSPFEPVPVRVLITGVRIQVPDGVELYGIMILGHQVAVRNVEVSGAPKDALYVGGRGNDGFAARVSVTDSRFLGGRRNVISATGVIDLRLEHNVISGGTDTWESNPGRPYGNPAAGIDVEPGQRGAPALTLRIAENRIIDNAGPGILLALSTNSGLPVLGSQIEIVGNEIRGNGRKATPPQHGGIVINGGQDAGGGRLLVADNVIAENRGGALVGRPDVNLVIEERGNRLLGGVFLERARIPR